MMKDDFVRLKLDIGSRTIPCDRLGLDWPPPEYLLMGEVKVGLVGLTESEFMVLDVKEKPYVLRRESYSQIPDADIAKMDHVVRGAEYRYVEEVT